MSYHGMIYIKEGKNHASAGPIYHDGVTLYNNLRQNVGQFASATAGSGVAITAAQPVAFGVYADDNGAALSSAVLMRAGRFRTLLTYTGGNREQEVASVIGQIVSKSGTNRHNMCGVMGSYEVNTGLTIGGQAWTTDVWVQAAVIGRVGCGNGITTVDANGVLAGLAAMSNTTSFLAQNGIFTGIYVGSWSGCVDWKYGIYIQGGAVKEGIRIGESASVYGSGVKLDATYTAVLNVFGDDGGASISSGTFIRSGRFRTLLTYTAGNREQEAAGAVGQLVSVAGTNYHNMCGLMGSYEASTSLVVGGQAWATDPWIQAAVIGRVGVGSAITTINAYGILAGVAAMSNTTSFSANNGYYAAFFAGKWSGTTNWGYLLVADPASLTNGIQIGDSSTGMTLTAYSNRALQIYTTCASTDGSNSVEPVKFDFTMTGAGGVGGRMRVNMNTNVALAGWANAFKASVDCKTNGKATGLLSVICTDLTLPASNPGAGSFCCYEANMICPTSFTGSNYLTIMNIAASGSTVALFDTNGLLFDITGVTIASTKFVQANTATAATHAIKCRINGTLYYVMLTSVGA